MSIGLIIDGFLNFGESLISSLYDNPEGFLGTRSKLSIVPSFDEIYESLSAIILILVLAPF